MTELITVKGSKEGLVVRFSEEGEFEAALEGLKQKFKESSNFFEGGNLILDLGKRPLQESEFKTLEDYLKQLPLNVRGIMSDSPITKILAQRNGMHVLSDSSIIHSSDKWRHPVKGRRGTVSSSDTRGEPTLLIKKTLRAGQKVNFQGNVVVLGDVNPGAEIIAGGDIIVFGALRGLAHAGATGNEDSVVVALQLLPTQLRISKYIGRAPEEKVSLSRQPEIAKVKDGGIYIHGFSSKDAVILK